MLHPQLAPQPKPKTNFHSVGIQSGRIRGRIRSGPVRERDLLRVCFWCHSARIATTLVREAGLTSATAAKTMARAIDSAGA